MRPPVAAGGDGTLEATNTVPADEIVASTMEVPRARKINADMARRDLLVITSNSNGCSGTQGASFVVDSESNAIAPQLDYVMRRLIMTLRWLDSECH